MISVVVPAHDEGAVIGRLLDALAPAIDAGTAEVVVVANGCTDDTVAAATRPGVTVLELAEGSKPAALNAGDAVARTFPRFYVDGDVVVSASDLEAMARRLDEPGIEAVAPRLVLDTSGSGFLVRSYHRYWCRLDAVERSLASRGCWGVSREGRERWDDFPDLVADDQFANRMFSDEERVIQRTVTSTVTVPTDLASLVNRKRRSHRGNLELRDHGVSGTTSNRGWLSVLRRHPARALDLPAFLAVTVLVRLAAWRDRREGSRSWGADRSSRVAP